MTTIPSGLVGAFERRFGGLPAVVSCAPGRVDLLGAHVDYNDGRILAMAIDRHVWVLARRAGAAERTRVLAVDLGEEVELRADRLADREDAAGRPLPVWARYIAGVTWVLSAAGVGVTGIDAAVSGEVPIGAGVSSSAALEVAFAGVLLAAAGAASPPLTVAALCRRAENEYVGVACGIMDQFCSVLGRQGEALLLDCRTLEWQSLALPTGATFVLADTGTRRRLSDGALNVRQRECRLAVDALAVRHPAIRALRDVTPEDLEILAPHVPEPALSRARHIVSEDRRVLAGADALRAGDPDALGRLMNDSHASSRDLYDASGPALEAMLAAGRSQPGCLGGRFIGAGFAGCALFLVRSSQTRQFVAGAADLFVKQTGLTPDLGVVRAASGARSGPWPPR